MQDESTDVDLKISMKVRVFRLFNVKMKQLSEGF